jgi:hypothetical protein
MEDAEAKAVHDLGAAKDRRRSREAIASRTIETAMLIKSEALDGAVGGFEARRSKHLGL